MKRSIGLACLLTMACLAARAQEIVVPLMPKAPTLDGKIDPAEWSIAAGFDGFQDKGLLQRRRVLAYVGATADTIYIAFKSQLPDEGELTAAVDSDSLKVVRDDAVEVMVNPVPRADDRLTYQMLTNVLGRCGYTIHPVGKPDEQKTWAGPWKVAHGRHDRWWHAEVAVPLASMNVVARDRKTTDGSWRINLTRDWKNPWHWSSLDVKYGGHHGEAGYFFHFVETGAPAVQFAWDSDPHAAGATGRLTLHNPGGAELKLAASIVIERNNMFDIKSGGPVVVAPGKTETVTVKLPEEDPSDNYTMALRVSSADGKTVYYRRSTKWLHERDAYRWVVADTTEKKAPVDFRYAYYPYLNKLRMLADISGLPKQARPAKVTGQVRKVEGPVVATFDLPLADFEKRQQTREIDLPPLEGRYVVSLKAEGPGCPEGETTKEFVREKFPWEKTALGRGSAVYKPFEPVRVKDNLLTTVLRKHTLNDVGLVDQVLATSAETGIEKAILAAPMRYLVTVDGKVQQVQGRPIETEPSGEDMQRVTARFAAGPLLCRSTATWDIDGTAKVELTLESSGGKPVESMILEIPLTDETGTLIHANADRIRAPVAGPVPQGEGVVWDATKVVIDAYIKNFCPYVYVGSAVRGICWFAENDRGWSRTEDAPNMDIVRRQGQVVLRLHLVGKPLVIDEPRTITFGLLAAPVKPGISPDGSRHGWRYAYIRGRYDHVGTDINWFAGAHCGSVYPAQKDLWLWEMMARGNKQKLGDKEVQEVTDRLLGHLQKVDYGRVKTPEGRDWLRRVVRVNILGRHGRNLVFYFNRATNQCHPEFDTFKDEWLLDDYRTIGPGKGTSELKLVPSESFVDMSMYWYVKSFEVAGNKGIEWDNFFFRSTYNTEMTGAYRREDGTLVPSTGVWGLRQLVRRTWTMMNQREMVPLIDIHMSSFAPLPLLSFATCQHDWEWKFGQGDVQDRHSRAYILLATTGELAGVWNRLVVDRTRNPDPWMMRTFNAVRTVHEIDGYNKVHLNEKWAVTKATRPIFEMLKHDDLEVFRYWDDRVQPVTSHHEDLPVIVYSRKGREAVVAVTSYRRDKAEVMLTVDAKALGFEGGYRAVDVETGRDVPVRADKMVFDLIGHDFRVLRLTPEAGR